MDLLLLQKQAAKVGNPMVGKKWLLICWLPEINEVKLKLTDRLVLKFSGFICFLFLVKCTKQTTRIHFDRSMSPAM
jgi:hypothetical protein